MSVNEWIFAIEGSASAGKVAAILALVSAFSHAIFSAAQKGQRYDPFTSRASIDAWFFIFALPIVVFIVPFPNGNEWLFIAGILPVHLLYKITLLNAYKAGDFSIVYPVVRGSAPLFTAFFAIFIFEEYLRIGQWLGLLILSCSICLLAWRNTKAIHQDASKLKKAMLFAVATGMTITIYTIYDAYGMRQSSHPFVFLAWFFLIDGISFPLYALIKWQARAIKSIDWYLIGHGAVSSLFGFVSFGSIMIALRLDHVGAASALRETSVIFAAFIGWLFLGERIGLIRFFIILLIGLGAILVEFG